MEVGVVIGADNQPIFWHLPENRTGGSLPDSRKLWDVLWENRGTLLGVAHSHPGDGLPIYSYTDSTTFAAIESALGRRLDWWITSETHMILVRWVGPDRLSYGITAVEVEPGWANELRKLSGQEGKVSQ